MNDENEEKEEKEFDISKFKSRMKLVTEIVRSLSGGIDVGSRIDPILKPEKIRTTSQITQGEVRMCMSLISFAYLSPEETYPCLDYVEHFLELKLSEGGFAIDKAIDLGKALTQKQAQQTFYQPEKPTEGMKEREKE